MFNSPKDIHLLIRNGVIIYYDDEAAPLALFHHGLEDVRGCIREAKQRRDIQAYIDDADLMRMYLDRGAGVADCVVAVPNTSDVLGIFQGTVEFSPVYKRVATLTQEDIAEHEAFDRAWITLITKEQALLDAADIGDLEDWWEF